MKTLIISKENQISLDNIVLGEEITVPVQVFDDKKPNYPPSPSELTEKGNIKLNHYLASKDYESAVSLISRSMIRSQHDLYWFKPYVSTVKDDKRKKSDRVRQGEIRERYLVAVKKGSEALFTIGDKANDEHYTKLGVELLLAYEKDKESTGNNEFRLAGNFGKFAHRTLLPLSPYNEELKGFIVREYIREKGLPDALNTLKDTSLYTIAKTYFREEPKVRKAA